jgi:hypothetical protein
MERWEQAARDFLAPWLRRRHVSGALVCGSYVTGHPTPRSDIDVQIVLAEGTAWRERGNEVVDGFLIEHFANPPERILRYFEEDQLGYRRITATMFCTGRVLFDRDGSVARTVREARRWQRKPLPRMSRTELEATRYAIWDVVDNALDAADQEAPDLPFQYYQGVRFVYESYARFLRQPVIQVDRILRAYGPRAHPEKYLLDPFPDPAFVKMLVRAIREDDASKMPGRLKRLARHVTEALGGFEIDGWRFRTPAK